MVTEFRVVISDKDDNVSSFKIQKALQDIGINVQYVEITADYEDDDEED